MTVKHPVREAGGSARTSALIESLPKIKLMGLPIHAFTPDALIGHLIQQSGDGRGGYLMTPNLDNLRNLTRSDELFARAMAADIRVADGMPLIWASRVQGTPLPARVAGSDLVWSLTEALARSNRTLFLLGGSPGTADAAAKLLTLKLEGLKIVGTACPPHGFEASATAMQKLHAQLRDAAPDFVYIGLPFDKASALAAEMRAALPATWFLGLGISFSFICGDIVRAPRWMQRTGLEWAHRLTQEPRRLVRRYLIEGMPFVVRLLLQSFLNRHSQAGLFREAP